MFLQLGLSPAACASLARLGYETPTPIQIKAIPLVLTGGDVVARAHTGTGKTAAFGMPMIERLVKPDTAAVRHTPRGLVLVPTRELAVQVHQALSAYAAYTGLRVAVVFGGVAMNAQVQALRRGADIVVATPGRLLDHMQRRTVDLSAVGVLTLDEADRMLDMGFLPALRRVVAALPRERQTLLFSATLPEAVLRLSAEFTRDAVRVDVSAQHVVAATVTHQVHHVAVERKRDVLTHILTQPGAGQALVFCRTKRGANRVGEDLGQRGVRTGIIHGNKSQSARTRALDDFKAGRVRVLVATDIAARGLDIVHMPLVVNFDLPLVAEDYVHRVGRTGRAGHARPRGFAGDGVGSRASPPDPEGSCGPDSSASRLLSSTRRKHAGQSSTRRRGRTRFMDSDRRTARAGTGITGAGINRIGGGRRRARRGVSAGRSSAA